MSEKQELRYRIEAEKKRLEARLADLRADASKATREESAKLRAKLEALPDRLEDKWDTLSEDVARKLNAWLADEER